MKNGILMEKMRNIGIVAHIDAGKTTFTERVLHHSGYIHKVGEVHDGNTVMDWMKEEQERGITISSASISCSWNKCNLNIIDTPGHVDFTIEVERSLRVLDGVVVVFCAVGGVESQSETVWHQADRYGVPKIAFINKIDRVGADFEIVLREMRQKLKATPVLVNIPWGVENNLLGVIDLIRSEYVTWDDNKNASCINKSNLLEEMKDLYLKNREILLETVSEVDEDIMNKYLSDEYISPRDLAFAIRTACCELKLVPVFVGSALRNKGIELVLDGICDYLPSPLDLFSISGINPKSGELEKRLLSENESFSALVFKVQIEKGRKLIYIRIYSGSIKLGDELYNVSKGKKEKVTRLLRMYANKRKRLKVAFAGEIVGIVGLKYASTGDTLTNYEKPFLLESIKLYNPVISVAVESKTVGDQEKLIDVLKKLMEEDPSFKFHLDKDTGELIVSGMGELHLDVLTHRIKREYNLEIRKGQPRIVYRETISKKVSVSESFDRKLGDERQEGSLTITLVPNNRGEGNELIVEASEEEIPVFLYEMLNRTKREVLSSGVLKGYPVLDITVIITKGKYVQGVSTELGFKLAFSAALRKALLQGESILLEPIMDTKINIPREFMGEIINDLNTRKGKVENIETHDDINIINVKIPLSNMFSYSTILRSNTQGRGTFNMYFSHYDKEDKRRKS